MLVLQDRCVLQLLLVVRCAVVSPVACRVSRYFLICAQPRNWAPCTLKLILGDRF